MLCIRYERGSVFKPLQHKDLRVRPVGIDPPTYGLEKLLCNDNAMPLQIIGNQELTPQVATVLEFRESYV